MRNHNSSLHCWLRVASGSGGCLPLLVGLVALAPLTGCAAGEGELFLNDVKTFYLNGGLTASAQENSDPSKEAEGSEKDALVGQVPVAEDAQPERGGLLVRALMVGIVAGQCSEAIGSDADGEDMSEGEADDLNSIDTWNCNLEATESIPAE